ncbi:riboflavin-aldehyde forming enzyme, partial [Pholiota conissans]
LLAGVASAGKPHYAVATWYYPGIGACGIWNTNNDKIVALPLSSYGTGNHCGQNVKLHYQGRTVIAKVVDMCPSCGRNGIDLSLGAFQALAPPGKGVIQVVWEYV